MAFPNGWPFSDERFRLQEEVLRALTTPFFPGAGAKSASGVYPPINLYDDGETFFVRAEMPGVDRNSLEVTAQGDQLTLRGERKVAAVEQDANYHRRECESGQFRRVLTLPQAVDSEKISATYRNGVLEVELPRAPELKPRKISIH